MSILRNKHALTAMIVAPVLAIGAYFAFGLVVDETPQPAKEGQSYQLVEMPNCRYDSGICGLKNGDFKLEIVAEWEGEGELLLMLKSEFPLEGVKLAQVKKGASEETPANMHANSEDGLLWSLKIQNPEPDHDRLRLVASSSGALYFGDVAMKFAIGIPGIP